MQLLMILIFNVFLGNHQPENIDLTITVNNINTLDGNIELGIFNEKKTFLKKGKEYKVYSEKVTDNTMTFTISDLPKDDYTVSVYHDVNADSKCNLNFFGIPVEPYGFSNNFRPKFSKPTFKDCKITANEDVNISIDLID